MSASPPRHDAWPAYKDVAFVLILRPGKERPIRGLILDWRGTNSRKQALVAYVAEVTPTRPAGTHMEWIVQEQLVPVVVDPNVASRNPF